MEGEQILKSVVNPSHLQNDVRGFAIGLSIVDVGEYALRYLGLELKPLVGIDVASDGFVLILFIVGDITQKIGYMLSLIYTVGGELGIKIVEFAELNMVEGEDAFLGEEPLSGDAVALKLKAVDLTAMQIDLLHTCPVKSCVLGDVHLAMGGP